MAIQYYMRAYNTDLARYVDWVVNDAPDSTGQFSGYLPGNLINITVNRTVQSKVDNFLKPNQSLGGTDGNFFHVNSYDWRNATAPILPPSSLTGISVERGIDPIVSISGAPGGATNTSPIIITTSSPHTLVTGQIVTIIGVTGNTNANGTWPIVVTGPSTFTLTGSVGNGTQTADGTGVVYTPKDMSVLAWDEANQIWRFFFNTAGDGTTVGASQDVSVNNFLVGGYIAIGPDPADTGAIRLSNNQYIFSESNPSGADVQLIGADTLNRIKLGFNATDIVYDPGVLVVDGYIQHDGTGSDTAQTTGFIREKNNTNIIAFRGAGALAGSDIVALGSNTTNNVVLGDAVNTGVLYKTSTGSLHQFQVNNNQVFEIGTTFARFTNNAVVINPTISQTASASGSGQTLTIQAQDAAAGSNTGGVLTLKSGTQGSGGSAHGTVDIVTGTDGSNPPKIRVFPTANAGANNNSILYGENLFRVDAAQLNPLFRQDDQTTTGNGNSYTIQAQNATLGSPSKGGNLYLLTGKGNAAIQDGYLFIQTGTGAVPQIVVSPVNFPAMQYPVSSGKVVITGNLEVQGTTTTVDSTIVDIVGQVIHANWTDPATSSPTGIPTTNVGYSIHRGNTGTAPGVPRDGAAWIWAETGTQASGSDGYWHALTIPGDGTGSDQNFTIGSSTNSVGVMALDFTATSDPNPVSGYVASAGSLRVANNLTAVAARNNSTTTTVATGSNLVDLASIPSNTLNVVSTTGFTTSGTILIFSDAGVQTLTYTGISGTTFTGVSAGTGIIHTGNYIAQTNKSTTTTGVQSLPTGTINVTSTTGFPSAGTLRIVVNVTAGSGTAQAVKTVTYTGGGGGGTQFTGCTLIDAVGGNTFVGGTVTSIPAPGTQNLLLLGTDFGNRIVYGSAAANTGHIFNTSSGSFYDFQVNSVSQVQLGQADIEASGFSESIQIGPTVSNPRLVQQTKPDTGTANGFNLGVFAQAGQLQTGVNNNNNGGNLYLVSGPQGLGGGGTAGIDGYVELRTGFTSKVRVFPTFALSAADSNSILYFENLFRVDTAQLNPLFRQDDVTTASATGQNYTVQAQNATGTTSNGGAIILTSGTGTTLAGNVRLQTGGVDRIIVYPNGSPTGLPQGGSNLTYSEFRDTSQGVFIVPVSAGISTVGFASTVTGAQIAQVSTASTPSAPMTVQSQVTTAASGQGGTLSLIAGNATGTTSTGGNLNLASGSGTSTNGVINFQPGGTTQILISATGQTIQWVSTVTSPTLNQATTGSASGQPLTVQAQNAVTTGGDLDLTSGTGTTAGNINLQTGGVTKVNVTPTQVNFNGSAAATALTINPVSNGTTEILFAKGVTSAVIDQTAQDAGAGSNMTVHAQDGSTTGGNLILSSGSGTTAGNTQIQTGLVDRVVVHPTFTEFRDTAEALRITPLSAGNTQITFASTDTGATINQATTASASGADFTIQAQNAATNGADLILTTGTGATSAGNIFLQCGGVDVAEVMPNQFAFRKGLQRHVTAVSTTYQVLVSDEYIAADTSTAYTITLPASPTTGDTYTIKDATGGAGTNTLTISGNGANIDGSASMVLNQAYAAATLTYTGSQWSVT